MYSYTYDIYIYTPKYMLSLVGAYCSLVRYIQAKRTWGFHDVNVAMSAVRFVPHRLLQLWYRGCISLSSNSQGDVFLKRHSLSSAAVTPMRLHGHRAQKDFWAEPSFKHLPVDLVPSPRVVTDLHPS